MSNDNNAFKSSIDKAMLEVILKTEVNVRKATLIIERRARQNCPVDLGILRASIGSDSEITAGEIIGYIGCNSEYAPYVHQGTGIYAKDGNGRKTPWKYVVKAGKYKGGHVTKGQRPQPFLENARDQSKDLVETILRGII